jgi:hypothetical protein
MRAKPHQLSITDKLYEPLVKDIFAYWQMILNHPRSILDPMKFKVIVTQLELGHTPENLMLAIEGVAVDPWDGRRQHDSLDVIFRSENIDKFMSMGEEAKEWAARQREKADKAMAARAEPRTPTAMPTDVCAYLNQYKAKMVKAA